MNDNNITLAPGTTEDDIAVVFRTIRHGSRNELRLARQRALYDCLTSLPGRLEAYEPQLYSNVMAALPRVWGVK